MRLPISFRVGIVPQFCENLYKQIEAKKGSDEGKDVEYEVCIYVFLYFFILTMIH